MDAKTPPELNKPAPKAMDLLLSRRSGSAKAMTGPGPDKGQLEQILTAAARVPDHGKLFPWRFIVFEGEGRARMGELMAKRYEKNNSDAKEKDIEFERERFMRAPVVVGVVSRVDDHHKKIPVWEQELSAGAVCQNMLIASHALGFVAGWITEWCAYDRKLLEKIGLKDDERIAGYVYIGTSKVALDERPRPKLSDIVTYF
jgi:nitroreductase